MEILYVDQALENVSEVNVTHPAASDEEHRVSFLPPSDPSLPSCSTAAGAVGLLWKRAPQQGNEATQHR